jgi:hypothetical protein
MVLKGGSFFFCMMIFNDELFEYHNYHYKAGELCRGSSRVSGDSLSLAAILDQSLHWLKDQIHGVEHVGELGVDGGGGHLGLRFPDLLC